MGGLKPITSQVAHNKEKDKSRYAEKENIKPVAKRACAQGRGGGEGDYRRTRRKKRRNL